MASTEVKQPFSYQGAIAPVNPGENPRLASLLGALLAATEALDRLRLDDPRRGELARRIRAIEEAIDGNSPVE